MMNRAMTNKLADVIVRNECFRSLGGGEVRLAKIGHASRKCKAADLTRSLSRLDAVARGPWPWTVIDPSTMYILLCTSLVLISSMDMGRYSASLHAGHLGPPVR